MKKHTYLHILILSAVFLPAISYAQLEGVRSLLIAIRGLINLTTPVLIGLATVYFLWGVGQFILKDAGDGKTREDGKKKMLWGIIALFVMLSIFGILHWIGDTVGISVGSGENASGGIPYNCAFDPNCNAQP